MDQVSIKYSIIFHCKGLPNLDFWFENIHLATLTRASESDAIKFYHVDDSRYLQSGWPDWETFCLSGDCFHCPILFEVLYSM
jgi:hypothetical protein